MASSTGPINLSGIIVRPYSDSEIPTEFGPNQYTPVAGRVPLSRIRFRAWEDNFEPSIGGSTPPGGGGGGGETPHGSYAIFINNTTTKMYAYKQFAGATTLYVYADVYIPSAAYTTMQSGGGVVRFYGEIIDVAKTLPTDTWEAVYLTNRNTAGADDGKLYFWNYWSGAGAKIQALPDTWYAIELGFRFISGDDWEGAFRVNGSAVTFNPANNIGYSTLDYVSCGNNWPNTTIAQTFYVDNFKVSLSNWVSDGGTLAFSDNFETGDFSLETGTFGGVALGTPPA